MFSDYYPYIQDICKVLIPSIITYFATKHSIMHPKKYAIREKQFNLVYLPLYLLNKKYEQNSNLSDKDYIQKVSSIINKNFQYVFTDTIKLLDDIKPLITDIGKENLDDEMEIATYIFFFNKNIKDNYNFLRKYLGYPTKSPIETFKRDRLKMDNFLVLFSLIAIPFITINNVIQTIRAIINQEWGYTIILSISLIFCIYGFVTLCIPAIKAIFEIHNE